MCQYPNCITRAWQTDSFADSPLAEDRVDEHCGLEGHPPLAQTVVAGLSNGCGVVRLAWMYCTTEAQRNHEKKELDPLSR
jgi:hypothetical protein